jgi:hypothetical protein
MKRLSPSSTISILIASIDVERRPIGPVPAGTLYSHFAQRTHRRQLNLQLTRPTLGEHVLQTGANRVAVLASIIGRTGYRFFVG